MLTVLLPRLPTPQANNLHDKAPLMLTHTLLNGIQRAVTRR